MTRSKSPMRRPITQSEPPQYTLAPLLTDGRNSLACLDVAGLKKVTLRGLLCGHDGRPWYKHQHWGDDLFALAEEGIFTWPPLEQLLYAEFSIWTVGNLNSHRLRIRFPNTISIQVARGSSEPEKQKLPLLVEKWMEKRRFKTV